MSAPYRLPKGGRIDRAQSLSFTFDGKTYQGFSGDTLASALLGAGVRLVGRSFKYHRPRGIMSAGAEEPNGLVTLGIGDRQEPNIPSTMIDLTEGLIARSQNAWPSLRFDIMSINALAGPILQAGFYYKTFMGPTRRSWMFYERFIRRAAGLGRASTLADPWRYETRHDFTDILIVGAGPAGLAAALIAARSGCRVLLAEQDRDLGGSLLNEEAEGPAQDWLKSIEGELRSFANVKIMTRSTILGLYDGNMATILEKRDHLNPDSNKGEARQILTQLRARAIILATGAIERPLVFSNNDRPGIMLAESARTYLNRYGILCGRSIIVATNNDNAWRAAIDLAKAGTSVTLADSRAQAGHGLTDKARSLGIDILMGMRPMATQNDKGGDRGVRSVTLSSMDNLDARGITRECDLLCMSGGYSPTLHLSSHNGVKPVFNEEASCFVPGPAAPGQFHAGAITGNFSLQAAIAGGIKAGQDSVRHCGFPLREGAIPALSSMEEEATPPLTLKDSFSLEGRAGKKAFVDFQNDVTYGDIVLAHQEGYRSVEHLKRYTTQGMGTDQGKTSNVNALALMARLGESDIQQAGTTTFRPPYTPVAIGALVGRAIGQHFRPIRRTPLHNWHTANGAVMTEAGLWLRPWFYRWAGDDVTTAYIKEMEAVRRNVGISDVSSLGKIEVAGPDAAEFLNRLYVNGFAKLGIGKARYGIMLHDDGLVLDDGTTTRIAEHRFFMTTTTAQAGEVMSWLEFLLHTAWQDLRVHVTSLTDEWAGMSIAGPKARTALSLAFPGFDFSNEALPYMGAVDFVEENIKMRVVRLSFSGELAYELYCPANYGQALWERVLNRNASLDIKPYGLEALASLRIEKGHVAGLELDHRNNLDDLGLGKMAAASKSYVGKTLRHRPAERPADRWSLVGLEALDGATKLRGGAILFAPEDKIAGHGRGYITSTTWSVELQKHIALGLYQGGLTHEGKEVICAFPLKNKTARARIVSPHFIDSEGERLYA